MSTFGRFMFWSTVLTLPSLLLLKRKPSPDDEPQALIPADPPVPLPPQDTMPAGFTMPPEPEGYARMKSADVPAAAFPLLRPLLAGSIGTRTPLGIPGRDILAQIEPHYHEPGGPTKPWGWHKGVSLYERKGVMA